MFEQYKLNKYKECLVGMAYEFYRNPKSAYEYHIQTYLVIQKNGEYSYIKFRKSENYTFLENERMIDSLEAVGYKPLSYYIEKETSKKRTLAKSNFVRVK